MVKRHMQLSFRDEDEDIYQYIKSHRHPSEFVLEAVRYYRAANPKGEKEVVPLDSLISSQVKKQVEDYIKNMDLYPTKQSSAPAALDTSSNTEDYDFSEALSMFDDED